MRKQNTSIPPSHYLIAVDWGSTNFRAYLIDHNGLCLDSISTDDGVLQCKNNFNAILQQHLEHWLNTLTTTTVILSGMVGSKVGWLETPYIECPINIDNYGDHAIQLHAFNHGNCWLVPGAQFISDPGVVDVMRGEELQVIGAYKLQRTNGKSLFCCPGTHNKWVSVNQGQIEKIATSMTGEIFSLLHQHSILTHSCSDTFAWHKNAFLSGLKDSRRSGGLLNHLFSVRTNEITGKHSKAEGLSYLSGVLIGHDIQSLTQTEDNNTLLPIAIIGSSQLCQAYSIALTYFNFPNYSVSAQSSIVAGAHSLVTHIKDK